MDLPAPNKITVNAAEQDHLINSVTVFQGGRAEVKRRVELELAKGPNQVHIVHLPNCICEDSIRVEASGTAVISDVVNHSSHNRGRFIPTYDTVSIRSYSPYGNRRITPVTPRYNPSLQALEDERSVIQKQIDFLNSYGSALDNRCSALNDMETFLESYGSRRRALNKQLQDIDARIAQEEEEEARNQEQNQKVEDEVKVRGRRETNITVTVLAETKVKIELSLTYTVSEVSWTPSYDVRIPSSRSSNTPSTIILSYQGSVEQTTDEDWSNASLILSTTSPHFKAPIAPVLSTWQLRPGCSPSWRTYPAPASPYICGRGAYSNSSIFDRGPYARVGDPLPSRQGGQLPLSSPPARSSCLGDKYELGPPPAFNAADIRQAELVGSALGTTFKIPGRSNISSNSGTHKFLIGLFELPAEPEWTCVPSINESVFLQYTITNSSGYALLAGEADVFKGDDLVCKSRIPILTTQNESFVLPVGIDLSLQVTRAPLCTSKHTAPRSVFAFIGLKKRNPRNITTNSQRFTIQNSGLTTVSALRVSDHIPVSSSPAVKVNIISPQELKPMVEVEKGGKEKKATSWIDLSTGVHVRWAPIEGGGEGAVEWACAIQAGQKIDLKLEWEVIGDFY